MRFFIIKSIFGPKSKILIVSLFLVFLIAAGGGAGWYYFQNYYLKEKSGMTNAETDKLISKVAQLVDLPKDEPPTIATISDKSKLQPQPFFRNAKNGDILLIYEKSKKAILYDPAANRIVEIGPLNFAGGDTASGSASVAGEATPSANPLLTAQVEQVQNPTFVIRNGTNTQGLAAKYEKELKSLLPTAQVTKRENAANFDHYKTLLIDLTKRDPNHSNEISQKLGLNLSDLPKEEKQPENGDFLVILGTDKAEATNK